MSLAAEIARFYGQGKEQRNGAGYLTLCPVHGNTDTPALSVTDSGNGDVDVFCHGAGCDFKEIKDRFRQDNLLPEWNPETKNLNSSKKDQQHNSLDSKALPKDPNLPEKESFIWKQGCKVWIARYCLLV